MEHPEEPSGLPEDVEDQPLGVDEADPDREAPEGEGGGENALPGIAPDGVEPPSSG